MIIQSAWARSMFVLFFCFVFSVFFAATPAAFAAKEIPAPPRYYILDEPHVLGPSALRSLQALLVEHDRLTGEQFIIALFQDLAGEDLVDFTNRVFKEWKPGRRGKDNGVLLALYWKNRKARIEVGYGLEPTLTDAKSKRVLSGFLIPELKAGHPERALQLAALEILRILESPLIASGKAEEILRGGGFRGSFVPDARPPLPGWVAFLILGMVFLTIGFYLLTAREAHFTKNGWKPTRPWHWGGTGLGGGAAVFGGTRVFRRSGWGARSSGWGGFGGGGGRSGGGGASGSW